MAARRRLGLFDVLVDLSAAGMGIVGWWFIGSYAILGMADGGS